MDLLQAATWPNQFPDGYLLPVWNAHIRIFSIVLMLMSLGLLQTHPPVILGMFHRQMHPSVRVLWLQATEAGFGQLIKTGIYGMMWGDSRNKERAEGWGTWLWKDKTGVSFGVQGAGTPGWSLQGLYFGVMTQSFLFLVSPISRENFPGGKTKFEPHIHPLARAPWLSIPSG